MLGCVVDFEAAPEVATFEGAEDGSRRLERMGIQVVLDEMNTSRVRVASRDLLQRAHVGGPLAVGAGKRQSSSGERLDDAEDVGGTATDVLVIPPR